MKIITASDARIIFGRENRTSVERFNRLVMDAISKKKNVICLPVETTTDNFIARVKKAKFKRMYDCLKLHNIDIKARSRNGYDIPLMERVA